MSLYNLPVVRSFKAIPGLLFLTAILFLQACGSDGSDDPMPPSNLNISVTYDTETPGLIQVVATATNASFYKFNFGDSPTILQNTTGTIEHTYISAGDFVVTVQAHASESSFISSTENVSITLPDPTELGYESPESYDGYTLVWRDEFNGDALSDDWTFDIGDGCPDLCGWGNNELEYYKSENTSVADGFLRITAKQESFGGKNYTSSKIITKGAQTFQYGRIDIRAVLPKGQGMWPALWMLGTNIDDVGWPSCGEIDIMEMVGGGAGKDNTVHGTVHWDNNGSYANYGGSTSLTNGFFADRFHVFSITWDETFIRWYLDGVEYHVIDISPSGLSELKGEFYMIFNVAVGGNWPGSPNGLTEFPQQMIVDYVRYFQAN